MFSVLIAPHCDDESLFTSYTIIRKRPLVIIARSEHNHRGISANTRKSETISAMKILNAPLVFLGMDNLHGIEQRLLTFKPDIAYIPSVQGGNVDHDLIGKICVGLWGNKCIQYSTYSKDNLVPVGSVEIIPTNDEVMIKGKALDCYTTQLILNKPHFDAVRGRSEYYA